MPTPLTRKSQSVPVTSAAQGVGGVADGTGLNNTEVVYVSLVDETDSTRGVRPAGADIAQPVLAAAPAAGIAPATSGTIVANGGTVVATGLAGYSSILVTISGTYGAGATLVWEFSDDGGTTWFTAAGVGGGGVYTGSFAPAANGAFMYTITLRGFQTFRVRCSAWATPSGAIAIRLWPTYSVNDAPLDDHAMGIYNTTLPVLGNGTYSSLQIDANGRLIVIQATGTKTFTRVALTANAAAVQILPANAKRLSAVIANAGASAVNLANNATLGANGFPLAAGGTLSDSDSTDAWFAFTAGTGVVVNAIEVS